MRKSIIIVPLMLAINMYSAQIPSAGQILQEQRLNQDILQNDETLIKKKKKIIEEKPKVVSSDIAITVKKFLLQGDITVFKKEYLLEQLQPLVGKKQNLEDLYDALDIIVTEYRKKGFFLAKAYFPPQDITNGEITIHIIEGKVDESQSGIEIKGEDLRINPSYALKVVKSAIKPGEPLTKENLERGILLLSNMPGLKATANLEKGIQPDSTKIIMETTEGNIINPYISVENSGSRYTGVYKTLVGTSFKNLSSYGDELILEGTKSHTEGDLEILNLKYSSALGYSGLRVGAESNFLKYELGKDFESLDAKGESQNHIFFAKYPLVLNTKTTLNVKSSYEYVRLKDELNGEQSDKKSLKILRTGFILTHADKFLKSGYSYFDFYYHQGDNEIKDATSYANDQLSTGANTDGDFKKLSFNFSRVQRGNEKFFVVLNASGQYAYSNLDSSEKFQLGGAYGVRAYPTAEGIGDDGLKVSLEGRYILASATKLGDIRAIGFYDWGRVRQYKDERSIVLDSPNIYSLQGWGAGLNFGKPNEFDGYITYARRIGSNDGANSTTGKDSDGSLEKNRIWFSVRMFF